MSKERIGLGVLGLGCVVLFGYSMQLRAQIAGVAFAEPAAAPRVAFTGLQEAACHTPRAHVAFVRAAK